MPCVFAELFGGLFKFTDLLANGAEVGHRVVDLGFHGAEDIEDCSCHLIEFRKILDFITVLDKRANHPAVGHHVLAALHECIEPGAVGGWQRGEDG